MQPNLENSPSPVVLENVSVVCKTSSTEPSNCSLFSPKVSNPAAMATAQSVLLLAVHILLISEFILAKRDYYDILGVARDATERQIKKAFHKLALKYHPDRNKGPDAEAKFREIAEGERLTLLLNKMHF